MKRKLLFLLTLFLGTLLMAQVPQPLKKWKIGAVGIRAGTFSNDYGNDMSHQDLQRMLKDPNALSISMQGMNKSTAFYTNLSGSKLGFQVSVQNQLSTKARRSIVAFADVHMDSELLLDYETSDSYESEDYRYIGWCLIRNTVDLGVEYNFSFDIAKKWALSVGPSVAVGKTFNDQLIIMDEEARDINEEGINTKGYTMAYGHLLAKIDYDLIWRVNLSLQAKYGVGYEVGSKSLNYLTRNATDITFGLNYQL